MNPDWAEGYVADTVYPDRFFSELSPVWLNYVAAIGGGCPIRLDRRFTYLELGCACGTSLIANAAAFPQGEFHACEFNAAHVEQARRHAAALGADNIAFHEVPFQALLSRDLPPLDFIVLHGVYSWVSAPVRQAILQIVHRRLRPGGLVYLSYNCLPGWSAEAPLRKLLIEISAAETGDTRHRAERALRSLQRLSGQKLRYFTANPAAAAAVDAYAGSPSSYLVHEFLNEAWEPFYASDVADELDQAGARFLGSATLVDNYPDLVVSGQAAAAIAELRTERQRQLAVDFAVNRRFRRDVFVRGGAGRGGAADGRHLGATVIGSLDPEGIAAKTVVPRGAIAFRDEFVRDLQGLMRAGSMTMNDVVANLAGNGRSRAEVARNVAFLVAAGKLMPFARARTGPATPIDGRPTSKVVERALRRASEHPAQCVLPSEVLGNGMPVSVVEALAIDAWLRGARSVEMLAARVDERVREIDLETASRADPQPAQATPDARAVAHKTIERLLPSMARLGLID